MSKNFAYEVFWMRCLACLAVVAIHSIQSGFNVFPENEINTGLQTIQLFLMFGTPTFIFISEFLLSKSYPNGLPVGFFKKRIEMLIVPYFLMGILYGVVFAPEFTLEIIIFEIFTNIFLGNFVAYFILVIFQFYILHFFIYRLLKKYNSLLVITISLILNVFYLSIFNFLSPPKGMFFEYFWIRGHWLLIPAWIFYFSIGYYAGVYHKELIYKLNKAKSLILILPFIFGGIVALNYHYNLIAMVSSKRVDILLYTVSIILFIILLTNSRGIPPKIVVWVSKYSFSIYLLHKLVVDTIVRLSSSIYIHSILVFFISIIFSIAIAYLVNLVPYGHLIVGKLGNTPSYNKKNNVSKFEDEIKS